MGIKLCVVICRSLDLADIFRFDVEACTELLGKLRIFFGVLLDAGQTCLISANRSGILDFADTGIGILRGNFDGNLIGEEHDSARKQVHEIPPEAAQFLIGMTVFHFNRLGRGLVDAERIMIRRAFL